MTQSCDADLRKCFEKVYEIAEEACDGYRDPVDAMCEIMRTLEEHADELLD